LSGSLSPEVIFSLHPKIRWTAYSENSKVLFCQMRPSVESYTTDADDRAFMELGPLIMSGVAEQLTHSGGAGRLQSIVVNMDKDSVLLTKVGRGYLAISVNRVEALGVFQEIDPAVQKLL
jgi:hypothetical protein